MPRSPGLKRVWDCPPFTARSPASFPIMDYVADVLYGRAAKRLEAAA